MLNEKDTRAFSFMSQDDEFMEKYLYGFMDRFVYSAAQIEGELSFQNRKVLVQNLLASLKLALSKNNEELIPNDIIDIGNEVNAETGINGIRKINVSAGKHANFKPVEPFMIYMRLYELVDQYRNLWVSLDPYEREAYFHINLMRIHPFEDGNKRTSKIILTANLIKRNLAPVLITKDDTDRYYEYLNNSDYIGLGKFIESRSYMELQNMISLYKTLNSIPIEKSIEEFIPNNTKHMI